MGAENGLWDALLLASKLVEHETLNQLYELIDDLPTEIRAELAQRLLMG
ncbi:hypothetical protein ACN4EK_24475 [Pantanalinema rosaneae CENA516]